MTHSAEQLIAGYIKLRDQRDEISERHKTEMEPYNGAMEQIANQLQDLLNAAGGESIKTASGTAYRSTAQTTKMEDWPTFVSFVLASGDTELLVRNCNKTRYTELLEGGTTVPGVSMSQVYRINVRRS